jgi:hypothetical protein
VKASAHTDGIHHRGIQHGIEKFSILRVLRLILKTARGTADDTDAADIADVGKRVAHVSPGAQWPRQLVAWLATLPPPRWSESGR